MNMKKHILTALREEFNHWEELLASLSVDHISVSRVLGEWSTKDVIAHLWAWQQISVARVEAAVTDVEPKFPQWVTELQGNWEENADQTNVRIQEIYQKLPWSKIHQNWRKGFLQFLELGEGISERDMLDPGKYSWLEGYSLADILLASYDHHQEHLEKLVDWLKKYGDGKTAG